MASNIHAQSGEILSQEGHHIIRSAQGSFSPGTQFCLGLADSGLLHQQILKKSFFSKFNFSKYLI